MREIKIDESEKIFYINELHNKKKLLNILLNNNKTIINKENSIKVNYKNGDLFKEWDFEFYL